MVIELDFKFQLSDLDTESAHVFEAVLPSRSQLSGQTVKQIRLRDRYGLTMLAIWRQGEVLVDRLEDVELRAADVLLLKGARKNMQDLQQNNQILVLEPLELERQRNMKTPLAVGILGLVLLLTTFAGFHISTAMVIGSVLMVLTGCLTMDEAYQSIEWRSVFLIAGMLPLGTVMETTGTAQFPGGWDRKFCRPVGTDRCTGRYLYPGWSDHGTDVKCCRHRLDGADCDRHRSGIGRQPTELCTGGCDWRIHQFLNPRRTSIQYAGLWPGRLSFRRLYACELAAEWFWLWSRFW